MFLFAVFSVKMSIPMIMGANIGTSITGILVATTQAGDRRNFELAFSGATVHDMFNWLTVIVLLPIEIMTNYLLTVTDAIVASAHVAGDGEKTEFLTVITKPFTKFIIQVRANGLWCAKNFNKNMWLYHVACYITWFGLAHCGLVTPYSDKELG